MIQQGTIPRSNPTYVHAVQEQPKAVMRFAFSYILVPRSDGGYVVTFPDLPEATAQADTEQTARAAAEKALVAALSVYVDESRCVPSPSASAGNPIAFVPSLVAAKLALHGTMLAAGVSDVTWAASLEWTRTRCADCATLSAVLTSRLWRPLCMRWVTAW